MAVFVHVLASCLLVLALPAAASGGPAAQVLRAAPVLPQTWRRLAERVADDHPVVLGLSLQQRGLPELFDAARRVSDPASPAYGRYLSRSAVEELTAPHPSSIEAVEHWLSGQGVAFTRRGEFVQAKLTAAAAAALLRTHFHHVANEASAQRATLAEDFSLPVEVHEVVAAVYGLHHLPTPPRSTFAASAPPAGTLKVTPSVILSRYGVSGVTPSSSERNRQAVAEFADQTMGPSDLEMFLRQFVPSMPASAAKVHKFVGADGTVKVPTIYGPGWGGEASLDIDYIMGVAPGVLTEFWYFNETNTVQGWKSWTSTVLASDAPPLVHSLSWGFQGNLSDLGVDMSVIDDIDANLAKMAARGVSVLFASGDSGSGYVELPKCDPTGKRQVQDSRATGTVKQNFSAVEDSECCDLVSDVPGAIAWTYIPSPTSGQCKPAENGTAFEGEVRRLYGASDQQDCCNEASMLEGVGYTYDAQASSSENCKIFKTISSKKAKGSASSATVMYGLCMAFTEVTGQVPLKGAVSGGDGVLPVPVQLYPQWPGSSPWVTSVGGTTITDADATGPEVATQSFGSGGGFSKQFPVFEAQRSAVERYLEKATGLPPKGSFPPGGRATPDVAALAQGYQIAWNGKVSSTDGTSAATPVFAAMISLLNEARLKAGKPPMGYLNPWLYANPGMFTDVTSGTNALGRGTGPLKYGFNCTAGWDPVTGLGTPVFSKMLAAALAAAGGAEIVV